MCIPTHNIVVKPIFNYPPLNFKPNPATHPWQSKRYMFGWQQKMLTTLLKNRVKYINTGPVCFLLTAKHPENMYQIFR